MAWKKQYLNMSKEEFEAFLRARAGEILNKASDIVFEEVVDRVLGEEEEGQKEQELEKSNKGAGGNVEMDLGVGIREAAAVSDATKMQIRASPRLQGAKDEHVLAKVEGRVARKNLEFKEGNNPSHSSLLSVPRDLAIEGLSNRYQPRGFFFRERQQPL
jgi:hypothetical protein